MRRTANQPLPAQNQGTFTPPGISPPPARPEPIGPATEPERIDRNTYLIDTPTGKYTLALIGSRLSAAIGDIFILGVLGFALSFVPVLTGATTILDTLYFVGLIAFAGTTVGMRWVGLRVIKTDGTRPDLSTAIVRHIIPFTFELFNALWLAQIAALPNKDGNPTDSPFYPYAAIFTALWILDVFWMTWDSRKQTLHDKLARTYVIRRK